MTQLSDNNIEWMTQLYTEASTEEDRKETVDALATAYNVTKMTVRQILQDKGVYVVKEGKTEKQQFAHALWAITNIAEKEWMKLTLKSQKALMDIFRKESKKDE